MDKKLRDKKIKVLIFSSIFFIIVLCLIGYKGIMSIKSGNVDNKLNIEVDNKVTEKDNELSEDELLNLKGTEDALKADLPAKDRIELYLGDDIESFGFIYYDLTTNEKIAINENKVFTGASTYKVGLNMVVYDDIMNGILKIDEEIIYNHKEDFEDGTGILQNEIDTTLSEPVPLQKLLDLSIIESDNIASNMLKRTLGGNKKARERINAIAGLSVDTDSNKTTPEIQFRILKKLYENRDNIYYSHLLDILTQTEFHDRLDKYLPSGIVAHKIGNYYELVHDIGIVFTDRPYIIVTFSEDIDEAEEKIAKISEMIYNEQLKK